MFGLTKRKPFSGIFGLSEVIMAIILVVVVVSYFFNTINGMDLGASGNATRATIVETTWTILPLLVVVIILVIAMYIRSVLGGQ